jgi:hypothetical protein
LQHTAGVWELAYTSTEKGAIELREYDALGDLGKNDLSDL